VLKAIHLAPDQVLPDRLIDEVRAIPGLELDIDYDVDRLSPDELASLIRGYDLLLLSRNPILPDELGDDPGRLKYICYLHGSVRRAIGPAIIHSPIVVTNWGDHPAKELATGSLVLLLASLKDLHKRIMAVRRGGGRGIQSVGGTVQGLRIGIYGYGFAGKAFVELIQPLGADIRIYDPYAQEFPAECRRVDALDDLFDGAQAIAVFAGLTEETTQSVTAERLAMLPDQGVVINMARGAIIDQEALFAELKSGRLRAGLDVLSPDSLPEDHEARQWENLIWTCHRFHDVNWPGDDALTRRDEVVLENVRAFVERRPLNYIVDEQRYALMT